MSELLVCFPCCLTSRPQPAPRRAKIDRSMIGLPTDFRHTGHIGSGDMASGTDLHQVQTQMQSKGGYTCQQQNISGTPDGILVGSQ